MLQSDLKKAQNLSLRLKSLGYSGKSTSRLSSYLIDPEALKLKNSYDFKESKNTPPSEDALRAIIEPIVQKRMEELRANVVEVTPDLVKQIVQMMHILPENDKLEVSKGVRNASSFIYGKTRYQTEELMHGGSGGTNVSPFSANLSSQADGVTKIFTIPAFTTILGLIGSDAPIIYNPTTDFSATGTTLTLTAAVNAPSLGATLILLYA